MSSLPTWFVIDTAIMLVYGVLHTGLTTKTAVDAFQRVLPLKLWNILYSALAIVLLYVAFLMWMPSYVEIYRLTGIAWYAAAGGMLLALVGFFYCFKYTTSFWQWIGMQQVFDMVTKRPEKPYYRVRKNGPKRYVRFPHHFCLVALFWSQPVMTLDTLWLAIFATIYTYLGTVHQDSRGRRLLGQEWIEYSKTTNLMFPNPLRLLRDLLRAGRTLAQARTASN
jgi:protein-S-isoprenylcysteine O-methyltransferase Ste14